LASDAGAGAAGIDQPRVRIAIDVARVDELGDQISGNAWRAFHLDKKPASSARSSVGALFAFSAKTRSVGTIAFVGKANAKKADESGFPDERKNFPDRPI